MGLDYSLIKQKGLRELVIASVSIQSLPEKEKTALVVKIAALPKEGRIALGKVLKEEAAKLKDMADAQQKFLKENLKKVTIIKKGMQKNVRVEHEKVERTNSEKAAEELLKNL